MSEKKKMIRVKHGGGAALIVPCTLQGFESMFETIREDTFWPGDRFTLDVFETTQEEIDNLPEWDGF